MFCNHWPYFVSSQILYQIIETLDRGFTTCNQTSSHTWVSQNRKPSATETVTSSGTSSAKSSNLLMIKSPSTFTRLRTITNTATEEASCLLSALVRLWCKHGKTFYVGAAVPWVTWTRTIPQRKLQRNQAEIRKWKNRRVSTKCLLTGVCIFHKTDKSATH